jgi:hypothetical protein
MELLMTVTHSFGENELRAILDGLEGVTVGPWKAVCQPNFENGYTYTSVQPVNADPETMKHLAMASGEYHVCRMTHTPLERKWQRYAHDAAHIARLDPDTVRSIVTELLDRRKDGLGTVSVKQISKMIMLEIQGHDFGHEVPAQFGETETMFRTSSAQIDLLEKCCNAAADRVLSCLTSIGVEAGK